MIVLNQVPDVGKNCDWARRHPLRDYVNDAAARVELARTLIFDNGMSVGGELGILKRGSLIPTRVTPVYPSHLHTSHVPQNAYYTELGVNPARLMPVDPLHDWEIGVGKNVCAQNVRIFHAIGKGAVNLFDTRFVHKHSRHEQGTEPLHAGSAKFPPSVAVPSESLEGVFPP